MGSSVKSALVFLGEFLRNPRQLGSIIPSSGFLKRRIIAAADLSGASLVVELGPGNGGTTRAILKALPSSARLISIELNEGLYTLTSDINDSRYIAHHGNASDLTDILQQYGAGHPDVVISGIPFSCMEPEVGKSILACIQSELVDGGRFVAYQVSARVDELNEYYPADQRSVAWEWLNVPPLRVWRWCKSAT
jgi:phospholipid N-methyltransferase